MCEEVQQMVQAMHSQKLCDNMQAPEQMQLS